MHTRLLRRLLKSLLALTLALPAGSALALEFNIYGSPLKVDSLFTVGASMRMQTRDPSLIGKSSLYKDGRPGLNNPASRTTAGGGDGLCFHRTSGSADSGADMNRDNNHYEAGVIARGCTTGFAAGMPSTAPQQPNLDYVHAPGSYAPNGDEGDLNFDKFDIVHATAKITSDLTYTLFDYNIFLRGIYFFDANYNSFSENHPDTTFYQRHTDLPDAVKNRIGMRVDLLDYNVSHVFHVVDRDIGLKVGNQVLNWGESSLLFLNSLNSINPPNATRARIPGFDLKEAFQPVGLVVASGEVVQNVSLETFYQYDWRPIVIDPVGSFYSTSDTLGDGGDYAMLGFGKNPDDPHNLYRPIDTCVAPVPGGPKAECVDSLGALGSHAGRTVYRDHAEESRRKPKGPQYGIALKTFLESFNNGTELSFYYANYHSRLPVVSAFAANATCLRDTGSAAALTFVADCGYMGPGVASTKEPIPVDTMRLIVEYPKDIHMMGVSFNTTVGDFAVSGEYAYRPNLPIQVHTTDLTFTALQPAFPQQDINAGALNIPGRQSAFPTFLTAYRGYPCTTATNCIKPGQYIRGYESMKVGQLGATVLKLIGGDNPLGASQMTLLLEGGMTEVFGMPGLDKLQFQGAGTDTHISNGADGTQGINPAPVPGNARTANLLQNPTTQGDRKGFGTAISYGYRFVNLNRWDDAVFGVNLELLTIVQHDLKGVTPGIGGNFVEGRKQFAEGVRFDYLSKWQGEVRYTWYVGGEHRDTLRDRDNIMANVGYLF